MATAREDTQVILLDVADGREVFRTKLDDEEYTEPQAACSTDGLAVIGSRNSLLALDIPARKVLWRNKAGKGKWVPAINANTLILLSGYSFPTQRNKGQLLEVRDLRSGKSGKRIHLKAGIGTYFPALVFSETIVVSSGGFLLGLNATSLKESWRLQNAEVYQIEQDEDSVFIGGTGPFLWQVEALTGKRIWNYEARPK